MKSFLLLICCLSVAPVLQGDPIDYNNGRGRQSDQAPVQVQQPQQVVTPKAHSNPNYHVNPALPGNPMLHGNPNVRYYGQGHNQVQSFKHSRQFQLSNVPNPKIAGVKFHPENHIAGSEHWQGQHYDAFRSYHAQWHDHDWWRHHHPRIILIGGGWYFWDSGFWCPAWGYDPAYSYYPYDGPIYAYNDLPPDQVIANVQASLQEQGYYTGEIDGTLGPLTRAALAAYQRDHGLYMTAAIDQPTLASLGME
jgi:Putative peptidoglycan binding domain